MTDIVDNLLLEDTRALGTPPEELLRCAQQCLRRKLIKFRGEMRTARRTRLGHLVGHPPRCVPFPGQAGVPPSDQLLIWSDGCNNSHSRAYGLIADHMNARDRDSRVPINGSP